MSLLGRSIRDDCRGCAASDRAHKRERRGCGPSVPDPRQPIQNRCCTNQQNGPGQNPWERREWLDQFDLDGCDPRVSELALNFRNDLRSSPLYVYVPAHSARCERTACNRRTFRSLRSRITGSPRAPLCGQLDGFNSVTACNADAELGRSGRTPERWSQKSASVSTESPLPDRSRQGPPTEETPLDFHSIAAKQPIGKMQATKTKPRPVVPSGEITTKI